MKRKNTQNLSVVLKEYMRAMGIEQKLKQIRITKQWEEIIGRQIANQTEKIFIKDRILFAKIQSSIIKQEILFLKSGIIKKINDLAKEKLIKDIIIYN